MVRQLHGSTWKINEQKHSEILELIAKIKVKGLTEAERVEIVKAIGLSS